VQFKTKPELALDMLRRAVADGIPPAVVLADSAYGTSHAFREGIRAQALDYAVGVAPTTTVRLLDSQGRPRDEVFSVRRLARDLKQHGGFPRCTWRQGTKTALTAQFAVRRVVTDATKDTAFGQEHLWLLIEGRDGESEPANYFLPSLPEHTPRRSFIRTVMQRWRTERVYQDLKGELGLDHYE